MDGLFRALIPQRVPPSPWVTTAPIWAERGRFRDRHRHRPAGQQLRRGRDCFGQLSQGEPSPAKLSGATDAFLTKLGPTLNLALTETVSPNPVGVGNNVTFTYKITNNGDLTTGIIFTDILPSAGPLLSPPTVLRARPVAPTLRTVTCTVGTLNGGAVATVTVVLAPTLAGSLSDGGKVLFSVPLGRDARSATRRCSRE